MTHYHASLRLAVTAQTREELAAELHLAVEGLARVCAEAIEEWDKDPNQRGVQFADPLLSGGAVVGVLCRHTDPKEN